MATTDVSICNTALAHVGDVAKVSTIAGGDSSVQAHHCARFYPIAREACLKAHEWGFATRRAQLVELAVDPGTYAEVEYAYVLPTGCLKPIGFVTDKGFGVTFYYRVETLDDGTQVLLTDCPPEAAYLRYVFHETNPARYPMDFVMYLSYELAVLLAGPLRKADKVKDLKVAAREALLRAAGSDSNVGDRDRQERSEYRPPWVENR